MPRGRQLGGCSSGNASCSASGRHTPAADTETAAAAAAAAGCTAAAAAAGRAAAPPLRSCSLLWPRVRYGLRLSEGYWRAAAVSTGSSSAIEGFG